MRTAQGTFTDPFEKCDTWVVWLQINPNSVVFISWGIIIICFSFRKNNQEGGLIILLSKQTSRGFIIYIERLFIIMRFLKY